MKNVKVTIFPKRCACCGQVLHHVQKMSGGWDECRNQQCLVWKLGIQEEQMREEKNNSYLERARLRREERAREAALYLINPDEVRESMTGYGILITREQIEQVWAANPGQKAIARAVGEWETCCREAFVNAIGKWLGLQGRWPLGMDTKEYSDEYFKSFVAAAKKRGLPLSDSWSES